MPVYELECPHCHHSWEVQCKFEELQLLKYRLCRDCYEPAAVKISQTAKPVFNGSGFYETDYKKKP